MTTTELERDEPWFYVADGDGAVTARKVFTGTGERLEVIAESLNRSIRLDAIALESVAWQDAEDLVRRAEGLDRSGARAVSESPEDGEHEDPIRISNEYADARVRKVEAADGRVLEITAPKLGYGIRLGRPELEWLATQGHDRFTEWLEYPFGPATHEHDH